MLWQKCWDVSKLNTRPFLFLLHKSDQTMSQILLQLFQSLLIFWYVLVQASLYFEEKPIKGKCCDWVAHSILSCRNSATALCAPWRIEFKNPHRRRRNLARRHEFSMSTHTRAHARLHACPHTPAWTLAWAHVRPHAHTRTRARGHARAHACTRTLTRTFRHVQK